MAINLEKIPRSVLTDLLVDAEIPIEKLRAMSPKEVFGRWMHWQGIIGYSDRAWELAQALLEQE